MARSAIVRIDRYSRGAIWFHWIIAALIAVNLTIGLLHESLLDGVAGAIPLHQSIGLTVLALTLARIGWRLTHRPPRLPASLPSWERAAARASHAAFYALLLALPLSGWAMGSAGRGSRDPMRWFGLFEVPHLPVSAHAAAIGDSAHAVLGYAMAALVVAHVAAALRHHFMLHDAVLARMLPGVRRRDRAEI
ncbi:cytochrome b [Sphingomonas glacialis]|uniref:Cytochrome b n=1 Tax=Sphingomonas glacialis TaxID=658225 RepID=A0A502G395_9SPHN|nr:cytochrome b/b6 domain-containing protein [Sphingomonas glacialis]TPG56265.1 cytochrome b [Sphingomonas glacialis]